MLAPHGLRHLRGRLGIAVATPIPTQTRQAEVVPTTLARPLISPPLTPAAPSRCQVWRGLLFHKIRFTGRGTPRAKTAVTPVHAVIAHSITTTLARLLVRLLRAVVTLLDDEHHLAMGRRRRRVLIILVLVRAAKARVLIAAQAVARKGHLAAKAESTVAVRTRLLPRLSTTPCALHAPYGRVHR